MLKALKALVINQMNSLIRFVIQYKIVFLPHEKKGVNFRAIHCINCLSVL